MNGPIAPMIAQRPCPLPASLETIARPASLLPGENAEEFEAIREIIIQDVAPQSGVEWLWTIDLIELSWDIRRYRALRHKVLETHRQHAIEQILRRIDCTGIPSASQDAAYGHKRRTMARRPRSGYGDRGSHGGLRLQRARDRYGGDHSGKRNVYHVRQFDTLGAKPSDISAARNQCPTFICKTG